MRAALIYGTKDIRVEEVPQPKLLRPTDAIVQVAAACVCGSDLWSYRGIRPVEKPRRIGHEFVGRVVEVGGEVTSLAVGDFVIAPFSISCGRCANCRNGWTTSCLQVGWWASEPEPNNSIDGGQGEFVRVPQADGTLVVVPGSRWSAELIPDLLTLSDVLGTGHHAAISGGVGPGATVAVVGDGAVGLCAVLAARRLGAAQVVAMSRHASRQALATEFGATEIVAERGDAGVARVKELFDGLGPDVVLECVGTKESMDQALRSVRPGGQIGFVGVPAGGPELPVATMFGTNVGVRGGVAPVRSYLEELLPEVLDRRIQPGRVFDLTLPLAEAAAAYQAMDERRAIKVLLRP